MKSVASITVQCKELLEASDIPNLYKGVMRDKYDMIESLLKKDRFSAKGCEIHALDRFQKLLQEAQFLHDFPSAANSFSALLLRTNSIINFLQER